MIGHLAEQLQSELGATPVVAETPPPTWDRDDPFVLLEFQGGTPSAGYTPLDIATVTLTAVGPNREGCWALAQRFHGEMQKRRSFVRTVGGVKVKVLSCIGIAGPEYGWADQAARVAYTYEVRWIPVSP